MTKSKVYFHQINLHHCITASIEVNSLLETGTDCVIFIQEPYVYEDKIRKINRKGFDIIYDHYSVRPRACLAVSKSCTVFPLQQFCSNDLAAAYLSLSIGGSIMRIIIASAYMPSESDTLPPSAEIVNLVNFSKSQNVPLLLGCDANSHRTEWGSSNCNSKGESLLEFILSSNLVVLNKGNEPTFINKIRKEVLDISLSPPN